MEFNDFYVPANPGQKATTRTGVKHTGSKQSPGKTSLKRKLDKFCLYHGMNSTHVSDECKVLKAQAEKLAQAHQNVGAGKYARNDEKSPSAKKKMMQSFKVDVIEGVVDYFTKRKRM